jgi:hypothetical protein
LPALKTRDHNVFVQYSLEQVMHGIGKAALVSADALDEVMHLEYVDIEIPEPVRCQVD